MYSTSVYFSHSTNFSMYDWKKAMKLLVRIVRSLHSTHSTVQFHQIDWSFAEEMNVGEPDTGVNHPPIVAKNTNCERHGVVMTYLLNIL